MTNTYTVTGMTCTHCAQTVEAALREVPGVERATVKYIRKEATVEGTADPESLKAAVQDAGYGLRDR